MKADNSYCNSVEQFKCLRATLTDQNCIQEKTESRMRSGNAWCHLVQNVLSSSLIYKNIQTEIYRTVIWAVVFYGCGTWSFTLREGQRLREILGIGC